MRENICHLVFSPKFLLLFSVSAHSNVSYIRAVYTRENKPRLTISAAYIRREHPV